MIHNPVTLSLAVIIFIYCLKQLANKVNEWNANN
jgi:hypothetical protein